MAKIDHDGMTNTAGVAYGDLIRRQRKAKKMKQEELGTLVRVGKNAVGAWEAGRSRPDVGSVPVICEALDLTLEEFFGYPDRTGEEQSGRYTISPEERASVLKRYGDLNAYNRQVILRQMTALCEMQKDSRKPRKVVRLFRNELAVSAGPGETLETARGEEIYLFADDINEAADEVIRVNGDSMEPTYHDGEMVLVRHTNRVRPGEIGVFVCGDTGYIKEFREDGLHSHNSAYATVTFAEGEDVRCIGRVIGTVRRDSWTDEENYLAWRESELKGR